MRWGLHPQIRLNLIQNCGDAGGRIDTLHLSIRQVDVMRGVRQMRVVVDGIPTSHEKTIDTLPMVGVLQPDKPFLRVQRNILEYINLRAVLKLCT